MKQRYILILILVASMSLGAFAQVPGYLGKRMSVTYNLRQNLNPMPVDYLETNTRGTNYLARLPLGRMHILNAGYALGERFMLGVELGYAKMKISSSHNVLGSYYYDYVSLGDCVIKNMHIGLSMKVFSSGFLAPAGSYNEFVFSFHKLSSDDFLADSDHDVLDAYFGETDVYKGMVTETNFANFTYRKGFCIPVTDQFAVDFGFYVGIGLSQHSFDIFGENGDYSDDPYQFQQYMFNYYARNFMSRSTRMGITLGVSFLN